VSTHASGRGRKYSPAVPLRVLTADRPVRTGQRVGMQQTTYTMQQTTYTMQQTTYTMQQTTYTMQQTTACNTRQHATANNSHRSSRLCAPAGRTPPTPARSCAGGQAVGSSRG
jgi:hypothetical protein